MKASSEHPLLNLMKYTPSIVTHLVLSLGALVMIGPFLWMILTSLKTLGESTLVPPILFPHQPMWSNYTNVLDMLPFMTFFWNTVVVTIEKTVGQVLICSLAGYSFARINFPLKNTLFLIMLSVLMVPTQVHIIPQYLIMKDLGLLNTLTALVLPGLFSAYGTFMLRQFFMTLPKELEESAKLDGCNHFTIYRRIMLPLAKPGLIALAIFVILWSWNDLMWPLIVNNSLDKMTLAVGVAALQGDMITNFPEMMAGSLMAIFPMLVMFLFFQRQFIEGIATTGLKG